MLIIKKLSFKNFLAYGNKLTTIELDKPGSTLISGINNDDPDNSNNGVGKSSLINALTYGIFGRPHDSEMSIEKLVNNINGKGLEVTVEFEKDKDKYIIHRTKKNGCLITVENGIVKRTKISGGINSVQIFMNGEDKTPDSIVNSKKLIEKILGITYEVFCEIIVFSATSQPFLKLPPNAVSGSSQTGIIEKLFNITVLTEKANILKEEIKDTKQVIAIEEEKIKTLEKEYERYSKQIIFASRKVAEWEDEKKQKEKEIINKLKQLKDVDFEKEKEIHDKIVDIEKSMEQHKQKAVEANKKFDDLVKKITKIGEKIKHLTNDNCPYCLQKFPNAEEKIKEERAEKTTIETEKTVSSDQVKTHSHEYKRLEGELVDLKKQQTVSNFESLLSIKGESAALARELKAINTAINPHKSHLDELKASQMEEINYDKLNELKNTLEHQEFLLKLLTKKDSFVRKILLNKNIPFLNQRLQLYLTELGLPHKVYFTPKLQVNISKLGKELEFGSVSHGQKARINLALSFAFRDVLEKLHYPINVWLIDEILDVGLDSVGVRKAVRLIKRKARDEKLSIFLISHRDEIDSAFDRNIVIEMNKGFSTAHIRNGN